jgi:anti-sigma B factor antagonist
MIEVVTRQQQDAVVVSIKGDVDLYSSPSVRKVIIALTEKKTPVIMVDLSDVSYMDSSGVATLVEGLQQTGKYKGRFKLFGLGMAVREVFELSRLDKVFWRTSPDRSAGRRSIFWCTSIASCGWASKPCGGRRSRRSKAKPSDGAAPSSKWCGSVLIPSRSSVPFLFLSA